MLLYNQGVLDKERTLRQELEITRATQSEMEKRLALYQRMIKQLNERIETEVRELVLFVEYLWNICDNLSAFVCIYSVGE